MKQLTVAYENNDLHALLKLELEWLNKDEDNISKLTDEKLAIYNETLKEQVLDAETEINMLLVHERYLPLQRYVRNPETTYMEMRKAEAKLRRNMATAEKDAAALKGAHALKYVKELITDYKRTLDKEKKDMIKDIEMDLAMFIDLMGRNNR